MTFKKPSRNSSSGNGNGIAKPNDDVKADDAPPDDTRGHHPTVEDAENKRVVRSEAVLAEERMKREKARIHRKSTKHYQNRH